jgi:hypothetical protein
MSSDPDDLLRIGYYVLWTGKVAKAAGEIAAAAIPKIPGSKPGPKSRTRADTASGRALSLYFANFAKDLGEFARLIHGGDSSAVVEPAFGQPDAALAGYYKRAIAEKSADAERLKILTNSLQEALDDLWQRLEHKGNKNDPSRDALHPYLKAARNSLLTLLRTEP